MGLHERLHLLGGDVSALGAAVLVTGGEGVRFAFETESGLVRGAPGALCCPAQDLLVASARLKRTAAGGAGVGREVATPEDASAPLLFPLEPFSA